MAIEVKGTNAICSCCGTAYKQRRGNFSVSYSSMHKGLGYLPYCRDCVDRIYSEYFGACGDTKKAVRQMCRKLDVFWSEKVYDGVAAKNVDRSIMSVYLQKVAGVSYAGRSYDDTLINEGAMWLEPLEYRDTTKYSFQNSSPASIPDEDNEPKEAVTEDIITAWGPGLTDKTYMDLEKRYDYWIKRMPPDIIIDVGTEMLIRQICHQEMDIIEARATGKPTDKSANTLNTLLGSLNLKPTQKKDDGDAALEKTPMGVWIKRWENYRPVPDPDPEMQDVDGIVRYIEIWLKGHLSRMLGLKNTYSKMYEDKINELRVDRPEFEDEDEETIFNEVYGEVDAT